MNKANPTDKHVGTRLRMRRLMLNMTQTEIGNALGVTFQQVQKYENGVNRVSASRLQHLCGILQVPVSFFFDEEPREHGLPTKEVDGEAAALDSFLATTDGLALVKAFAGIGNKKIRWAIVALVEQIVAEPRQYCAEAEGRAPLARRAVMSAF
jgi:transcriptional regulator with XRE-family HTH domain